MLQTNLGSNDAINLTSFTGVATLLVNETSHFQATASAEECCMACASSSDASSLNTDATTLQALTVQQVPVACNVWTW